MRTVLSLLTALAVLLVATPHAAANTYVVYSCKTRLGTQAPTDGFTASTTTSGASTPNRCATGGPLEANLFGGVYHPANARATWKFSAPPNTEIRQFDAWRSSRVLGHATDDSQRELVQYTALPDLGYLTNRREWCGSTFCTGRGNSATGISPENLWYSDSLNAVRDVYFAVGCEGLAGCQARATSAESAASVAIHGVQWILTDEHNPVASPATGPLTGTGPHRGTELANFEATDLGSGLYWTFIEVKRPGGEWEVAQRRIVDSNGGRCAELNGFADYPYEFGYGVPCRLSASVQLSYDTAQLPDGQYEMRARIEDASGNSTNVLPARPFAVDNIPPPAATTLPAITGSPVLGRQLEGSIGTWTGVDNTYVTRWLRCISAEQATCTPIAGAADDDYFPVAADLGRHLRFEVTATNIEGSTTAVTAPVGPITNAAGVVPECADDRDNDADGKIDLDDPACTTREGTNEAADTQPAGGFTNPVVTPTPTLAPSGPGTTPTPPGTANGINASRGARMSATGPRRRAIGFGRRTQTTVSLRDENGKPITGATVVVLQRMQVPGARYVPAHAPVRTDAQGKIRYSALAGYSRTLRFAYKANTTDAGYAATRDLAIGVRSKTTLRTSATSLRNGETLRFTGRLKSRPVPRAGVVIDLQARVGKRWQSFSTVRTHARGAWKSKYTFRSTTGLQTYVFRARVRGDSGFPYLPSNSSRARVRVRG